MHLLLKAVYVIALTVFWASTAAGNCRVINTLDNLHAVETRLMNNLHSPLFTSEIQYLKNQTDQITYSVMLNSIETGSFSLKGATFLRFMNNARTLSARVSIDDPTTAAYFFSQRSVQRNIENVGAYLDQMRCTPSEVAAANFIEVDASALQSEKSYIAREHLQNLLTLQNIFIFTGLLSTLTIALIFSQHDIRFKTRGFLRYKIDYTTTIKLDDSIKVCTVNNISRSGARVKLDSNSPFTQGVKIAILLEKNWTETTIAWNRATELGLKFDKPLSRKAFRNFRGSIETP